MKTLNVQLPGREYAITIGASVLEEDLAAAVARQGATHVVAVTNTTLAALYPNWIENALAGRDLKVQTCVLPDGEAYKTLEVLNQVYDFLMEASANRKTLLVAFGGGVIGDMVGFAAGTFMRGIPFIQVPTTLLAHVDSSVGGKTAVNHPLGKNMIGVFKQPEHVCIDLNFLQTLPERELRAGYFELAKHGLIHDADLLAFLETQPLLPLNPEFLEEAVWRSCRVKAHVVEQDETEAGLRATLNFGHTLGHLVETHAGYGTWLHGEAVGVGMLFAAFASRQWSHLSEANWLRVRDFLVPLLPQVTLPSLTAEQFERLILHDKKAAEGGVSFILLAGMGRCQIRKQTSASELWQLFQRFLQEFPEVCRLDS